MKRLTGLTLIAAGIVGLSAVPAAAAVVTNDLNLRRGPGTGYEVITAMPAGARVDVDGCTGNWCQVDWRGYQGYASASYLAGQARTTRRVVPRYDYSYSRYDGPGYWRYGYYDRPRLGFGLRIGSYDYGDSRWARYHRW